MAVILSNAGCGLWVKVWENGKNGACACFDRAHLAIAGMARSDEHGRGGSGSCPRLFTALFIVPNSIASLQREPVSAIALHIDDGIIIMRVQSGSRLHRPCRERRVHHTLFQGIAPAPPTGPPSPRRSQPENRHPMTRLPYGDLCCWSPPLNCMIFH